MVNPNLLPPPPIRDRLVMDNGLMSATWVTWFTQQWERNGRSVSSSNADLDIMAAFVDTPSSTIQASISDAATQAATLPQESANGAIYSQIEDIRKQLVAGNEIKIQQQAQELLAQIATNPSMLAALQKTENLEKQAATQSDAPIAPILRRLSDIECELASIRVPHVEHVPQIIEITGTTEQAIPDVQYIANNAALVTVTLPANIKKGSVVTLYGQGAGGWTIAQNASQTVHTVTGDTTTGVGGSLSSTNRYDCVHLYCLVENTDFLIINNTGTLTVV